MNDGIYQPTERLLGEVNCSKGEFLDFQKLVFTCPFFVTITADIYVVLYISKQNASMGKWPRFEGSLQAFHTNWSDNVLVVLKKFQGTIQNWVCFISFRSLLGVQLFAWSLDKNAAAIEGTSKQPPSTVFFSSLCHMESGNLHCCHSPQTAEQKPLKALKIN